MPLVINTLEADTYTYQRLVVNKRNFKKPGAHQHGLNCTYHADWYVI